MKFLVVDLTKVIQAESVQTHICTRLHTLLPKLYSNLPKQMKLDFIALRKRFALVFRSNKTWRDRSTLKDESVVVQVNTW